MAGRVGGHTTISLDGVGAGPGRTLERPLGAGGENLTLQMAPIVLGAGERLWDGLTAELEPVSARHTRFATYLHYRVKR